MELYHERVTVEAPAKINLFLEITGQAGHGYHLVETVMQTISLCDRVTVEAVPGPGIRVTCNRAGIPENEGNLAYQAAQAFFDSAGCGPRGLHIHIDKAIPDQAGLGGGSADAAAVLLALQRLTGCQLDPGELDAIGAKLGADVPYLYRGGCMFAEGIGTILSPMHCLSDCHIVLAKPSFGVSTKEAYGRYDALVDPERRSPDALCNALAAHNLAETGRALYNVFEALYGDATHPLKAAMKERGAVGAALSGSGSAVYGLFADRSDAEACAHVLAQTVPEVFLAQPVAHGPRILNAEHEPIS